MKRMSDRSGNAIQETLRAAILRHDAVIAKNNKGETYTLPMTLIKWELIPFLRYGLAKLGDIVSLSVDRREVFSIRNGVAYVNTDACEAYIVG